MNCLFYNKVKENNMTYSMLDQQINQFKSK